MAMDWYVDSAAVGGGAQGQAPADAHINVFSLCASNSVKYGDRVWVAKRYLEVFTGAPWLANFTTPTDTDAGKTQIIGWPNSGDPYYDIRPLIATSAGWDAHTQTSSVGQGDMPTYVTSHSFSNGLNLEANHVLANWCTVNSAGGSSNRMGLADDFSIKGLYVDNFVHYGDGKIDRSIVNTGKVTVLKGSSGQPLINSNKVVRVKELTIGSNVVAKAIFDEDDDGHQVDIIDVKTNSMQYIMNFNIGHTEKPSVGFIGTIKGNKPTVSAGFWNSIYEDFPRGFPVDDYYGEGPRWIGREGEQTPRLASVGELLHNSNRASIMIGSGSTANDGFARDGLMFMGVQQIQPTSGTAFSLDWPVLTDNASLFNANIMPGRFEVLRGDCTPRMIEVTSKNTIAGSGSNWAGTLKTAAASAYLCSASFTAPGSQTILIGLYVPAAVQGPGQAGVHSGTIAAAVDF